MQDMHDLPHGTLDKARSDFSPEWTTCASASEDTHNNSSTSIVTPLPESPMDIDMSVHPLDFAIHNMEHISSLEQALCSNFTCCNIQLPDLHALVEHFEEKHVVVFNLDGMRIYPENSGKRLAHFPPPPSLSHSPSSSRSSSVASSPQTPTTPLSASLVQLEATQKPRIATSPCPQVYTPFNMSTIPESEYGLGPLDLEIGPDPYPVVSCMGYDGYPSPPESLQKSPCATTLKSKSQDLAVLSSVDSVPLPNFGDATHGGGEKPNITSSDREKGGRVRTKADIVNATAVSAKNSLKAKARITGGNGKRREKAYRCPTQGCTKSYLNPNGLKYHVEKGTCRFEDATDSEVHTDNTRGTALPNASVPSTPAPTPSSYLVTNQQTPGGNKSPHPSIPSRMSGTAPDSVLSSSPRLPQHSLLSPVKTSAAQANTAQWSPSHTSTQMTGYTLTRPLSTIPC